MIISKSQNKYLDNFERFTFLIVANISNFIESWRTAAVKFFPLIVKGASKRGQVEESCRT
jgi:hypothetical protein